MHSDKPDELSPPFDEPSDSLDELFEPPQEARLKSIANIAKTGKILFIIYPPVFFNNGIGLSYILVFCNKSEEAHIKASSIYLDIRL
jgi:hypothetical protein